MMASHSHMQMVNFLPSNSEIRLALSYVQGTKHTIEACCQDPVHRIASIWDRWVTRDHRFALQQ
jgi:hypothetical protein